MIYVVVGPTASGKSHLAERIYKKLDNATLINGDAYQIYQDMNIGTAKISKSDPMYPNYKLLDIISPEQNFSVMEYQTLIRKEIKQAIDNKKDVIIVGGTGLYIRAALYDYEFKVQQDDDVSDLQALDNEELHKQLELLDPTEAAKIHQNNKKRMVRALSLIRTSGKSKTEMLNEQEHKIIYPDVKIFFINPDRNTLYEKINKRVDEMFELGWINEVRELNDKYKLSKTAIKAIGYEEINSYLKGEITLEECKEMIKKRTRNYAKRQITFFTHQFDSIIINNNIEKFLDLI